MNKTQIFLLSTGIILTTAAAAALSQRFLVTPNEVHQAAFGERLENAKQLASIDTGSSKPRESIDTGSSKPRESIDTESSKPIQTHTIKSTDGRTISYTSDNVHMKLKDDYSASKICVIDGEISIQYGGCGGNYTHIPHNAKTTEITLNGTITDLAGKTEHFSSTEECKDNEYQAVREYTMVDVYRQQKPVKNRNGTVKTSWGERVFIGNFEKGKYPHGDIEIDGRAIYQTNENYTKELDFSDTIMVKGEYRNQEKIVCSAGKTVFNY